MKELPKPKPDDTPYLARTVPPLRWVFWGALLCLVDLPLEITSSGRILIPYEANDLLGLALMAVGVFRLAEFPVSPSYRRAMNLSKAVLLISIVSVFFDLERRDPPGTIVFVRTAIEFFQIATIPIFCLAMRLCCIFWHRHELARSWLLTTWTVLGLNTIPTAIYIVSSVTYSLENNPLHVHLGLGQFGVVLLPVSLLPLILFYRSTTKLAHPAPPPVES